MEEINLIKLATKIVVNTLQYYKKELIFPFVTYVLFPTDFEKSNATRFSDHIQ